MLKTIFNFIGYSFVAALILFDLWAVMILF